MNGLSLFSGIGGLDLAFEWAGGKVAAMCEIEPFCCKVLRKHWPDVPIFNDVKELKSEDVGHVDIIYGGFPCQPFSVAGKKEGRCDDRYLWPEFSRLVQEIRPDWVVAENVLGVLSIVADDICKDLEYQGYSVGIWDFEAASVGAPHRRERVFFVAHSQQQWQNCMSPSNTDSERFKKQRSSIPKGETFRCSQRNSWRKPQPGMGGDIDGLSTWLDGSWDTIVAKTVTGIQDRVARIRALGNAVVPQQAYPIFKAIREIDGAL